MKILKNKNEYIYYEKEEFKKLCKNVLNKEYKIIKTFKNDGRTYVVEIEIENKKYILKEYEKESKDLWKRILCLFTGGEAFVTLKNTIRAKKNGLKEAVDIYGAYKSKDLFLIKRSFIIMEYLEGKIMLDNNSILEIKKLMTHVHKLKIYHGDCNPYNFIFLKDGKIKIIDSKLKKDYIGNRIKYDKKTLNKYIERDEK